MSLHTTTTVYEFAHIVKANAMDWTYIIESVGDIETPALQLNGLGRFSGVTEMDWICTTERFSNRDHKSEHN